MPGWSQGGLVRDPGGSVNLVRSGDTGNWQALHKLSVCFDLVCFPVRSADCAGGWCGTRPCLRRSVRGEGGVEDCTGQGVRNAGEGKEKLRHVGRGGGRAGSPVAVPVALLLAMRVPVPVPVPVAMPVALPVPVAVPVAVLVYVVFLGWISSSKCHHQALPKRKHGRNIQGR